MSPALTGMLVLNWSGPNWLPLVDSVALEATAEYLPPPAGRRTRSVTLLLALSGCDPPRDDRPVHRRRVRRVRNRARPLDERAAPAGRMVLERAGDERRGPDHHRPGRLSDGGAAVADRAAGQAERKGHRPEQRESPHPAAIMAEIRPADEYSGAMSYTVTESVVAAQATAVICESTTWDAFPRLWPSLLGEVWATARASAEIEPNRNVMLYRDDVPNVEIGVEVASAVRRDRTSRPVEPAGRPRRDDDASRRLRGIGLAHQAIIDWCDRHGLQRTGARWEIYGHATEHHGRSGGRGLLPPAADRRPCTGAPRRRILRDMLRGVLIAAIVVAAQAAGASGARTAPRHITTNLAATGEITKLGLIAHRHPRAPVRGSREAGRERRAVRDRRSGEDLVPQRLASKRQVLAGARDGAEHRDGRGQRADDDAHSAPRRLRPFDRDPDQLTASARSSWAAARRARPSARPGPISDLSDSSLTVADLTCSFNFGALILQVARVGDNVTLTCTGGTLVRMVSVGTVTHSS